MPAAQPLRSCSALAVVFAQRARQGVGLDCLSTWSIEVQSLDKAITSVFTASGADCPAPAAWLRKFTRNTSDIHTFPILVLIDGFRGPGGSRAITKASTDSVSRLCRTSETQVSVFCTCQDARFYPDFLFVCPPSL